MKNNTNAPKLQIQTEGGNQSAIKRAGGGSYLQLNSPGVPQSYLDALIEYGTQKQVAMARAYITKYQGSKARKTLQKRKSVTKPATKLNAWLKEVVRAYGATIDDTTYPGYAPSADKQVSELAISDRFFDTATFKSAASKEDSELRIQRINRVLGTEADPVKIKFLPENGGWLVSLAKVPVENCLKLFDDKLTREWIYTIDYTQDFAGYINIPKTMTLANKATSYVPDLHEFLHLIQNPDFQLNYEKDGVLFKGRTPNGVKYKFYDKVNSFVCNTGINSVGLTIAKSLTEPREPHIETYLNSESFKTRSIARIEITLSSTNIKDRDKKFDTVRDLFKSCYCEGDTVAWFEKILYPQYPTVLIDLRKLNVSEAEDIDTTLAKNARWAWERIDDGEYSGYKGGVVVAYYIEGNGAEACIQGFVMNNYDKAFQKCVGNRGVAVVTVEDWDGSHTVTYYKTDSKFKPTPTRADDFHNIRGAGKQPPECIKHLWLWSSERHVVTPRKVEEGTIRDAHRTTSIPKTDGTFETVIEGSKLPDSVVGLMLATNSKYKSKKIIHEIVEYKTIGDCGVFRTFKGAILKTSNKSDFENPKFYNSVTGKYQKSR